jgi:hypothetical protein
MHGINPMANRFRARKPEQLARITAELTPEQLAQAQRQLAAWQPGRCAQELAPAGASH